tara:strand:+ start:127 stop:966 length:840 start_codon:yes stop_codon:yes gene_type:complete
MSYIGIDLGGTKVRAAKIVGESCQTYAHSLVPNKGSEKEIIDVIKELISKLLDKSVVGIGIGVPSLVDEKLGIVYDVQNIPSWKKVFLKDILESCFNIPVFINNDVNCFSLGELHFGSGKKLDSFVGLSIGTGIAGGIIINKKLYNGSNFGAGEFGMLAYKEKNYEYYCSGQFFEKIHDVKGEELYVRAENRDKDAIKLFNVFGRHLGNLINQIMYSYDPEQIILGGSVSKSYDYFKEGIQMSLKSFAYQNSISNLKINVSRDPDISLKGAASLCFKTI